MILKEAAYRIALEHINALTYEEKLPKGKVTPEHEKSFNEALDRVLKKKTLSAKEFYDDLEDHGIDKVMLRDLVARVISKGSSEDLAKMVFLLGEGKPIGAKSTGAGLKILTESWIKRQLDDGELTKRVKPKFWPFFRDNAWIEKENQGIGKEKSF